MLLYSSPANTMPTETVIMKKTETSPFGTVSRVGHNSARFYNTRLYDGLTPPSDDATQEGYSENIPAQVNTIHCADSRNMFHLPNNSVHLMVTSPPYNVGKEYDNDLTLQEYRQLLSDVISETYRTLVTGGRACINIANVGRSPYIPLHAHIIEIALDCGFLMRGEIIWNKGSSAGTSCAWGSWKSASNPVLRDVHEYILVFTKGSYKRTTIRNGGVSTIGRDGFLEFTKSVWTFPTVSARKRGHPAPFPLELPRRLIQLYTFADDLVLDPFIGSGTTAEAAAAAGRRYVGYDINEEYVQHAQERAKSAEYASQQMSFLSDNRPQP